MCKNKQVLFLSLWKALSVLILHYWLIFQALKNQKKVTAPPDEHILGDTKQGKCVQNAGLSVCFCLYLKY